MLLLDAFWVLPLLALALSVGATASWVLRGATPLGRVLWGLLLGTALLGFPGYAFALIGRLSGFVGR